jgi:hypothetical protein
MPDGIYAVLREGPRRADVLPVGKGEVVVAYDYNFTKKPGGGDPRFLVLHTSPEVPLVLAESPKAVREGDDTVALHLRLRRDHARALERFTRDHHGGKAAIVVGGELATVHKIRQVITGGAVQITSCTEGGCAFLLRRLQDGLRAK